MRRTIYINKIRRTLLTLCLMVSATMVWADNVAKIGTTEYATLQAAIEAATNGQTITLLMDISTGNDSYSIAKQITIDLGGKTITANHTAYNDKLFAVTSGGKLTITGEGTITDNDVRGIFYNEGDLTIENGTFTTTNNDGYAVIYNTGSTAFCSVKGGTFTGAYAAVYDVEGAKMTVSGGTLSGQNGIVVQDRASLTVDSGIITGTNIAITGNGSEGKGETSITINGGTITNDVDIAIYHPQSGSLTINGGTITGVSGIEMKGGSLTVGKNAVITATYTGIPTHNPYSNGNSTVGYAIAIVENGEYAGVSTVNINPEAEINGPVAVVKDSDKKPDSPEITFDPDGLQMAVQVKDNTDKVVGQYLSLELAVKNAPAGSTIMLMDNVEITSTIESSKNYTLDLNGKTITSNGQRALWIKSGEVTIKSTVAGGKIIVPTISNKDQSVIRVGSSESAAAALTVAEDVTISADECYGVTVFGTNSETLTVNGNVNTKIRPAISGNGSAGFASTVITIGSTANITTTDEVAIYQPQAGTLTVEGKVTGAGGIEIKGGSLEVKAGAEITVPATNVPTHTPNNDGTSTRGYAIAIVENNSQNGAYGGGNGVSAVTINDQAVINGPIAELQDSQRTSFNPTYNGNAVANKVAAIGNDEYFTLNDAIAIVPSLGTVNLIDDLGLTSTFEMDAEKTYTFDLNGKTLTGTGCAAVLLTHGHVTIANGTITTTGSTEAIRLGSNDGDNRNITLTINNDANVTSNTSTGVLLSGTNTRETLVVKGKITTSDHSAIVANDEVAKIHVANGAEVSASDAIAIYQANTGELVVDGTVSGTDGIKMYGGNLKVSKDAHITAASATNYAIAIVEKENCAGVGKANISNEAEITGVIACLVESQNTSAAEPIFSGDITMVAETQNSNGFGEKYAKLTDAITAAIEGKEVKLLEDITVTTAVDVNKAITLNMDDYSIINNQTEGATAMTISDNATIKNGGVVSGKTGTPATELNNAGISVTTEGIEVALQNMEVSTKGVALSISKGTVTADQKSSFSSNSNNTVALSGGTLTLNGKVLNTATTSPAIAGTGTGVLTVAATATVSSATSNAINWASTANLTISGGKIAGAEAVYAEKGEVTIAGGTFTGTGNAVNIASADCTPSITGGTFYCGADNSYSPIKAVSGKEHFVSGTNTYFSKHIAQILCEDGYMVSQTPKNNGMFYLIDEIVFNDGADWESPSNDPFTIHKAKYTRTTGMGAAGTHYGTLCLPFSYSSTQTGMTFYTVERLEGNTLYLNSVTGQTINAGTPVVFKCNDATKTFKIESDNATVCKNPAAGINLVGTFKKLPLTTATTPAVSEVYFLNSDAFHNAKTSLTVPAYRAYIKIDSSGAKPDVLYIHTDDMDVDNINSVFEDNNIESIYDLQGRKQNELQKGMNIIKMLDGKTVKVYVK